MSGAIVPSKTEKIVLAVNRNNYKQLITQAIATRKIVESRDIGDFVGYPLEEYVRGKSQTIRINIMFFNFKAPPYTKKKDNRFVRVTYNIPDANRAKLDWLTIKNACGGVEGYTWGRFRATANLSNGRQMQVYGGSEEQASDRLKALLLLSTATLLTLTIAEEKKEGRRAENKRMYKESVRVYPGYFSITNFEKIQVEDEREFSGLNATLLGNFRRQPTPKIPLWVSNEPSNCKQLILEALRVRGVSV